MPTTVSGPGVAGSPYADARSSAPQPAGPSAKARTAPGEYVVRQRSRPGPGSGHAARGVVAAVAGGANPATATTAASRPIHLLFTVDIPLRPGRRGRRR